MFAFFTKRHDVRVTIDLAPRLADFIHYFRGELMEALDNLNARIDELVSTNTQLVADVAESNQKQDALIAASGEVVAALERLRDATNQGGTVTAADFEPLLAKVNGVIDAQKAAKIDLDAQDAETDTATATSTAAATDPNAPAPSPAPAPAESPAPAPAEGGVSDQPNA
jgi:hypothetical protein